MEHGLYILNKKLCKNIYKNECCLPKTGTHLAFKDSNFLTRTYRNTSKRPTLCRVENEIVDVRGIVAEIQERLTSRQCPFPQHPVHLIQSKCSSPHCVIHIARLTQSLVGWVAQGRNIIPEISPKFIRCLQKFARVK